MRSGIHLPQRPASGAKAASFLQDAAGEIEAAGFSSAWMFDALARGFPSPDPLTSLAVAATATEEIELGTAALQVPLRAPAELLSRILTTKMVTGDRLVLGVGAGSSRSDYELVGGDFSSRFRDLADGLAWILDAWPDREDSPLVTWPGNEGIPQILIAAWRSQEWLREGASRFDGWVASAAKTSWETLETGISQFRAQSGGRAVLANVAVDLSGKGDGGGDGPHVVCEAKDLHEHVSRIRRLGFDDVVFKLRHFDRHTLKMVREATEEGRSR